MNIYHGVGVPLEEYKSEEMRYCGKMILVTVGWVSFFFIQYCKLSFVKGQEFCFMHFL